MKTTIDQLSAVLKKFTSPIVLISGDEPLLIQEACQTICDYLTSIGYTQRERWYLESNSEEEALLNSTQHFSLFSEKRCIEITLFNQKLSEKIQKFLVETCSQPSSDLAIIITTAKLDIQYQKSAWAQAIEKHGIYLPIWPINNAQFPMFIRQRAKLMNLNLTTDAINFISDWCEGNLLACIQTLEQCRLLIRSKHVNNDSSPSKETTSNIIDIPDLKTLLEDVSRFDVFKLSESIAEGNAKKTLHILRRLEQEHTEPVLVLWAIARDLRIVYQLIHANASIKLPPIRARQLQRWCARISAARCAHLLTQAAEVDYQIKGAKPGNPWESLLDLCLNLTMSKA